MLRPISAELAGEPRRARICRAARTNISAPFACTEALQAPTENCCLRSPTIRYHTRVTTSLRRRRGRPSEDAAQGRPWWRHSAVQQVWERTFRAALVSRCSSSNCLLDLSDYPCDGVDGVAPPLALGAWTDAQSRCCSDIDCIGVMDLTVRCLADRAARRGEPVARMRICVRLGVRTFSRRSTTTSGGFPLHDRRYRAVTGEFVGFRVMCRFRLRPAGEVMIVRHTSA